MREKNVLTLHPSNTTVGLNVFIIKMLRSGWEISPVNISGVDGRWTLTPEALASEESFQVSLVDHYSLDIICLPLGLYSLFPFFDAKNTSE